MARWVKCAKCRTLLDAEGRAFCYACGNSLTVALPAGSPDVRAIEAESGRDRKKSRVTLIVLGLLGALGISQIVGNTTDLMGLRVAAAVIFILILGGGIALTSSSDPRQVQAGEIVLGFFKVIGMMFVGLLALMIGGALLILVICAM